MLASSNHSTLLCCTQSHACDPHLFRVGVVACYIAQRFQGLDHKWVDIYDRTQTYSGSKHYIANGCTCVKNTDLQRFQALDCKWVWNYEWTDLQQAHWSMGSAQASATLLAAD